MPPIVVSLDGNIGAGKSTLLKACSSLPGVTCVQEPVGEWLKLKNEHGESLLELFYKDKRRWGYTFQNAAILTRLKVINEALASCETPILITERSVRQRAPRLLYQSISICETNKSIEPARHTAQVLTDRYVFAEMLKDSGDIDALEWQLYCNWFDTFAKDLPMGGIIHVTTGVGKSQTRITSRGRDGESSIPVEYLTALDAQHWKWVEGTSLPVLRVSTEEDGSVEGCVEQIKAFTESLLSMRECEIEKASAARKDLPPVAAPGGSPIKR